METKQSKVTAIAENQRQWAGQNGTVYYHTITFENGDTGVYGSKTEKCEKFKVGEVADYTKETKTNGQFTNVTIKPAQPVNSGGFKKDVKDQGIITYLSCLSSACNFYASKLQASSEDVFTMAEAAFKKATEKSTLNK